MRVCLARGRGEARRPACGSDSVSPERPSRVPRGGAAFPCSSVHDTAVYRARAHTHTHAYACTQVERHIRGFTWPCTHALARHTYTRGIVERCAYVHEARARVPRSTHLFLSVRDTRRYLATEATATVRRHACVYRNQPAFRSYSVHSADYEGCDSFLPSEEREKRERGDLEWNFEWNFVRKFVDCGITGYWNRDRRRSWTIG